MKSLVHVRRIHRPVVLNWGSAATLGALEKFKGCRHILSRHIFSSKILLGVPPTCSLTMQGCREPKKIEKHCATVSVILLNLIDDYDHSDKKDQFARVHNPCYCHHRLVKFISFDLAQSNYI